MDPSGFRRREDIEDRRRANPLNQVLGQLYDQMTPGMVQAPVVVNELSRALGLNDLRNWNEMMLHNKPMAKLNPWEI